MRQITRRELSHNSAQILNEILDTGEPVEILTNGRPPLILGPKRESVYEQWLAQGLVKPSVGSLTGLRRARSSRTVEEILADADEDH